MNAVDRDPPRAVVPKEEPTPMSPNPKFHACTMGERAYFHVGNAMVSCAIMLVTPTMAREMLLNEHPKNRKTPSVTSRYAAEMTAGGWRASPQPLIFSDQGQLIDGGNRVRAIVASGCSVIMTVWFDWPEDAFACFDRNSPRTLQQADSMTGEALPKALYQMARASWIIDLNKTAVSDSEIRDRAKPFENAWAHIGPLLHSVRVGRVGIRAPAQLVFCLAWLSNATMVERFLAELRGATDHTVVPSKPVRNFIRWYEGHATSSSSATFLNKEIAYATSAALRQFSTNSDAERLQATLEAYVYWRVRPAVDVAFETV